MKLKIETITGRIIHADLSETQPTIDELHKGVTTCLQQNKSMRFGQHIINPHHITSITPIDQQ